MEVAGRQRDGLGARDDERVLGRRVELDREHAVERGERVVHRAVDLRLAAERERVVEARAAARGRRAGEQRAHPRGHGDLAGERPGGVDARVEHGAGRRRSPRTTARRPASAASARRRARTAASAARPMVTALLDEQRHRVARAGVERREARPAQRRPRAGRGRPWTHASPSPSSARPMSASAGQVARAERRRSRARRGRRPRVSAAASVSSRPSERPPPPAPSWLRRTSHRRADGWRARAARRRRRRGCAGASRWWLGRPCRRDRAVVEGADAGRRAVDGRPGRDDGLERLPARRRCAPARRAASRDAGAPSATAATVAGVSVRPSSATFAWQRRAGRRAGRRARPSRRRRSARANGGRARRRPPARSRAAPRRMRARRPGEAERRRPGGRARRAPARRRRSRPRRARRR